MIDLSVLDLIPVREGGTVGDALSDAALLAACAEQAGYRRFWVAEHHAMEGIAGGATAVVLAHIGKATRTIRIGAGGIMLPNHNPFVIAEQFGTLDALYPGRIDLGLGRAPTWLNYARCSPANQNWAFAPRPGWVRQCRCGCWAPARSGRSWPPR
jgi:luciferase family oxidoreductase group 1